MTNKEVLFTIPNKYFYIVWKEYVMKYVGLNQTNTPLAIEKWLGQEYDNNDWIWKEVEKYLEYMDRRYICKVD